MAKESNGARYRALMRASGKRVGVCVNASRETTESVPYLTHQDIVKQIQELTDMCDYLVINLSSDGARPAGIQQYYRNLPALDKLLKLSAKARDQELGKLAAYEFEQATEDYGDYQTTVKRVYSRNSIITAHRPLSLFVRVDPHAVFTENEARSRTYAIALTRYCLKYGIDGIVLCNDSEQSQEKAVYREQLLELIRAVRSEDTDNRLTITSAGCRS